MGTIQKQGLINTVIIYAGVLLGLVNRLIAQPYFLETDEVGLAGLLISVSGLLTTFFLLGSASMCVRYFPVFRDASKRHHGFFGFLLLFPLAGIALGGVVLWVLRDWVINVFSEDSPLFVTYFQWVWPLAAVMTLTIAMNAYSNSLLKTVFPSLLNDIIVRVLLIVAAVLYGMGWISFDWFVAGIGITHFLQLLLIAIYIFVVDRPGLKIDWAFVNATGFGRITRFSLLLTLTALSSLSLKFLDNVFVGAYLGEAAAGVYLIGVFIAQFIETPLYSVERIAGVKIAHAFSTNNMDEVREIYYRSVRLLFLLGGFLAICVVTNIHDFLRLMPPDFRDVAGATIILSTGSAINMATGVNSPILINSSKYMWGVGFLFILLALSVVLNVLLIPEMGLEGAALATGLASTLYNVMKFVYIKNKFGMQPYNMQSLKTLLVIGVALGTGLLLPSLENPWLAIAVRGSVLLAVYGGLTWMLKIVPDYHHLLSSRFTRKK